VTTPNDPSAVIDEFLSSLDTATTAGDVVVILGKVATFAVELALLAEAVETRLAFIASQTKEGEFRTIVERYWISVKIARKEGRLATKEELDG